VSYKSTTFNIRPLCLWAFLIVITIVFCALSIWAAVGWIVFIIAGLCALQFLKTRDKVLTFLGTSRIFFVGSIILCLAVTLSFFVTAITYSQRTHHDGRATLTGVIESYRLQTEEDRTSFMTISNAKFGDKKLNGRVIVFIRNYDGQENKLVTGNNVSFQTTTRRSVQNMPSWETIERDTMNINSRVAYTASVNYDNINVGVPNRSVRHVITRYSIIF